MSHLLHIDSSLRAEGSRSRQLSAHYAERWRAQHPDGIVTYRDLAADPIPHLDHAAFSARFVPAADHTPAQAAASAVTETLVDEVLGDKEFVVVTARGGGYQPGTPRHGWDHREPWLRHALSTLGVSDAVFIDTELTLARESPAMIPLDLGTAEDRSLAAALTAIDALFERSAAPAPV